MEIDATQACQVYLITHSQAELSKFPTRKSFGNAIAIAFNSSSKVGPVTWKAMKVVKASTIISHLH